MSSLLHDNAIYTQLDLLYEFCQWALRSMADPNQTHIRLYRGTNSFDEDSIEKRIDKSRVIMRLNNLTSFSADRDVASCFGDLILTVDVPLSKLVFFNTLLAKHALNGESEYLVIGGDYHVVANRL
jgi:NAD+--dinitrogen-reductase ADP-D-ribosyltransferase